MRKVLEEVRQGATCQDLHPALAYGNWMALDGKTGKPAVEELTSLRISDAYRTSFKHWQKALGDVPHLRTQKVKLESRLLVGHGNVAPTDVGITLHHTWGVPVIPGSALKGLLSNYMDATYGPAGPRCHPDNPQQDAEQKIRSLYQGVTRDEQQQVLFPPGAVYRQLFGAPETAATGGFPASAAMQGNLVFHDALYVPATTPADCPFAPDVLTIHQKPYYDGQGKTEPTDYHDPVPVEFLTVRPGAEFLVALSASGSAIASLDLCMQLLSDALSEWGVGGKTSLGYGRLALCNGM
ncbi:type III-B CRISPR module RAMP protein Cmr6 [Insolitispirillum peregrinum]